MNTKQINTILKKNKFSKMKFGGVYSSNCLPLIAKFNGYIINLDENSERGSHWVAIYFTNERKAEYFDSYGLPPFLPNILTFLNRNSTSWIFNVKTLQNENTVVCGQYCIYFILHKCHNINLNNIVNAFNSSKNMNDKKVYKFVKQLTTLKFKFRII
jgi:Ulp1 protease family, C-terminal catalytic domain